MHPTAKRFFLGLAALFIGLVTWWAIDLFMDMQRLAEYSAQAALMTEASEQLEIYFKTHREYPASLDAINLTYPDGGSKATLATLRYVSDRRSYSIVAQDAFDGSTLVIDSNSNGRVERR